MRAIAKGKAEGFMKKRTYLFDWLRLLGALLVVIGHSAVLLSLQPAMVGDYGVHTLGVIIFFTISGYLITGSWKNDPHFFRYAEKRARRIMPALLVVVFLTALVLGPLVTSDPNYFGDPQVRKYVWRNSLLLPYHQLPGVFAANPETAVNGSLWTLPVEVFMYVMTPILVLAGPWVCTAGAIALLLFPFNQEIAGFGLAGASSVIPFFMLGAAGRLWGAELPRFGMPKLSVDLSYGMYLLAFPTQQTFIFLHPDITPLALTSATVLACAPLAWLSWTFIEKPMVRGRSLVGVKHTMLP